MLIYIDDEYVFKNAEWNQIENAKITYNKKESEVLAVGLSRTIDDNFLSEFPNCKYILSPTTAIDHIKITNENIKIIKLVPHEIEHISASAEFAFLLIMLLLKKYPFKGSRSDLIGHELFGKTLGIIGFGRIGRKVSWYAQNFGIKILHYNITTDSLDTKTNLLSQSDIVLVSISSEEKNRNAISMSEFSIMKDGVYFVNISRGFIVNEDDLLECLYLNKIAGAALDVVENYGKFEKYVSNFDNLIITPHIAGNTVESLSKACEFVIKKLCNSIR